MLSARTSRTYKLGGEAGRGALAYWISKFWPYCIFRVLKSNEGERVSVYMDTDSEARPIPGTMIRLIVNWDEDTVEVIGEPDPLTRSDSLLRYIDQVFVRDLPPKTP